MNVLYPAISPERLPRVCEKLAAAFDLPTFQRTDSSQYLETARSGEVFQITVTEFLAPVSSEQAAQIGPPDYWNLAWRAAVGLRFNYQVAIARGAVTRSQQRSIAHKLRSVFAEIRLHGDPVTPNKRGAGDGGNASQSEVGRNCLAAQDHER
jgi:hypothetical protein